MISERIVLQFEDRRCMHPHASAQRFRDRLAADRFDSGFY